MSHTRSLLGGVLVALALLLLVPAYHVLAGPVVRADGSSCASVWHLQVHGGRTTGGFVPEPDRRAGAEACEVASRPGARTVALLGAGSLVGGVAGVGVLVAPWPFRRAWVRFRADPRAGARPVTG